MKEFLKGEIERLVGKLAEIPLEDIHLNEAKLIKVLLLAENIANMARILYNEIKKEVQYATNNREEE